MRAQNLNMLKFLSLGSGSSGNCYILYTETDGLMIDCGVGIRTLKKHLYNYGVPLSLIHHIIVTHDHADHIKSVGTLSSDYHIPVWATQSVHHGIFRNWSVRKKVDEPFRRFIEKGETQTIGEFAVTPFSVPHDSIDCVGYRIVHQDITFTIITDCGHLTDEIRQYIAESNYLIIEANHDPEMLAEGPYPEHLKVRIAGEHGHMCNQDCAKALAENATPKLQHVWLCHLSEENNHPELARKTVETILASYGIVCGKDFQLDILKRTMPSGVFECE